MELEKEKAFETIELDKENVRLARITLTDTSLMHDHCKKWFINQEKDINVRNKDDLLWIICHGLFPLVLIFVCAILVE